ncbi:hypothetical protein EV426DRAFT_601782 [Tirmania nivea]|nr:hypothetical protein EV426DRAFT_601782 [Tirmania nivea]
MWLYHTNEEVHLVVLIKLLEVPPARYITMAGETISRSRARKTQFEWPTSQLLFEGRTLEQEFHLRSSRNDVADRETSIEQILFDIRAATREYLLQADREGTLIPPLVEPIDATIYVYRRKEDNGDVSPVHNPLEKADTGDGIAGNQRGVVQGSLADGALEKDATGQGWRENSAGANWEDQALAEENEESERLGSGSRLEGGLELQSEEGSEQEDDAISKDGDETGLDLVWSVPFMHNGSFCSNHTDDSQYLSFTIAELYGPLPIPTCGTQLELCTTIIPPALLQTMPPSLHAHALKNITFPLTDFVEQIQESRSELARDRAFARADKIVDTAYSRWYDAVQAEETQAQMQKRKAVEMELREARKLGRKRKLEAALEEQED